MYILGISGQAHDAAAALFKDGQLIAAAEEERFTRIKFIGIDRAGGLPFRAIDYCLKEAGITNENIDHIGYFLKPGLLIGRFFLFRIKKLLHDPKASLYYGLGYIGDARLIFKTLKLLKTNFPNAEVHKIYHHNAHAASSFFASPFKESAILTIDGYGELTATSLGYGKENKIHLAQEVKFPHSLGVLYSMITNYLGFDNNADEYKVMGLASYGKPEFKEIFEDIVKTTNDGLYKINQKYFNSGMRGPNYLSNKFIEKFGAPRKKSCPITEKHKNIAASLQRRVEDVVFHMANHLYKKTKSENLCLSGGVALNCTMNGKLLGKGLFKNIFIQPAAGDPGTAMGCALYIYHQILNNPRSFVMEHAYYGPGFSNEEIKKVLDITKQKYKQLNDSELIKKTAQLLANGKIIGWFQGRMEWGPRALGNRSILADPTKADMRNLINHYVKHREEFRPFAPVATEEDVKKYFDIPGPSPFMLFTRPVKEEYKQKLPAITHIDGTARVQTVEKESNPRIYKLLKEFEKIKGVPILLNTSFNVAGEPIVCNPRDALRTFISCGIDTLVIGNYIVSK
jgi:carbamoyltransferase